MFDGEFKTIPLWSAEYDIDLGGMVGGGDKLVVAFKKLTAVLRSTNYPWRVYWFTDGFALVTKPERFGDNCTTADGERRWDYGRLPVAGILDYLGRVFFGHRGDFRIFVLLVTAAVPETGERRSWEDAVAWHTNKPARGPSKELINAPITDRHQCKAFVYHFSSHDGADHRLQCGDDSTPAGQDHLSGAGLLQQLVGPKSQ